jgi:hypothetical protein
MRSFGENGAIQLTPIAPYGLVAIGLPESIVTFHETREALAEIAASEEDDESD